MKSLRIAHIPFSGLMYAPFNKHMINMSNLENMYGITSTVLPSVTYFSENNIPSDFDILHIHGFPNIKNIINYLEFIKLLYLNNKKFVISVHNYSPICNRAILQDENRKDCMFYNCDVEECNTLREISKIIKNIPIFVYNSNIKSIFDRLNFIKVKQIPICYEWTTDKFEFKEIPEESVNLCGYFNNINFFEFENIKIKSIVNKFKDIKFYPIDCDTVFSLGHCLVLYDWNCSFPYEIGMCLSQGTSVYLNDKFKYTDFNDMKDAIYYNNFDSIDNNFLKLKDKDNIRYIAYEFWKNHGPHKCISFYDSYYRELLK
jgi:hypothetical protein